MDGQLSVRRFAGLTIRLDLQLETYLFKMFSYR